MQNAPFKSFFRPLFHKIIPVTYRLFSSSKLLPHRHETPKNRHPCTNPHFFAHITMCSAFPSHPIIIFHQLTESLPFSQTIFSHFLRDTFLALGNLRSGGRTLLFCCCVISAQSNPLLTTCHKYTLSSLF